MRNWPNSGITMTMVALCTATMADEVRVMTSQGARTRVGTVVDYRGDQLTLRSDSGTEMTIPSEQVVSIDATWRSEQIEGDQKFSNNDFSAAARAYSQAFSEESRRWVKRLLLSRVVRCQNNAGKHAEACKNFASLVADDEHTPYYDAIPLAWKVQQPSPTMEKLAQAWLMTNQPPVKQLMAASWLLPTTERASARRILTGLAKHSHPEIASLATAQSWRSRLMVVSDEQLAAWTRRTAKMQVRLRAGPYYVLGKAHQRRGETDQALLALMRLPTMYSANRSLAQAALVDSAMILEDIDQTSEAIRLYRQVVSLGKDTLEANRAERRLTELVR